MLGLGLSCRALDTGRWAPGAGIALHVGPNRQGGQTFETPSDLSLNTGCPQ